MPTEPVENPVAENLLADASERAKRLAEDLSTDAAELQTVSPRVLSEHDRREGQALAADAVRAAQRLHEALSRSK